MIRQAPLLFIGSLTVLCIAMGIAIWGIFKGNLERKNDLIKTLQDQLLAAQRNDTTDPSVIRSAGRANFIMTISGVNCYAADESTTGVVIHLRMKNAGAPSTAGDWSLRITSATGAHEVSFGKIWRSLELKSAGGAVTVIPSSGDLSEKLGTHQLMHGGNEEGDLWFMLQHTRKDQIVRDETMITVTTLDQDGTPFSTSTTFGILRSQGERN